ncbi:transposase [Flavobacterium sp. LC2016-01]|uniref:transposase n=1 Tax=Flavobacterium sp. LC2016-01 TaxID=2675876 RepID=UPI0012BAFCA0|nr:transposase [Flavobacterium sp. LC2016-01]MTH16653.1 transposase [Flavobacterium sp. LC2016-01]
MSLYKDKFKIDSTRLKNWDYSSEAVYFITMVAKNRECVFGTIEDDKMILNDNGKIIETELLKSIAIRKNWFFHNWVIMPNHIHLLIEIQNKNEIQNTTHIVEAHSSASPSSISTTECDTSLSTNVTETHSCAPLRDNRDEKQSESNFGRKPKSISSFVAIFKSVTTKQINGTKSIWQDNYHDHIVRNYKRFEIIYDYIKNNPKSWETDSLK